MCTWGKKKGGAWEQGHLNVFCSSYSTIPVHYSKSYLDIGKVQVTNTKREVEPIKEYKNTYMTYCKQSLWYGTC